MSWEEALGSGWPRGWCRTSRLCFLKSGCHWDAKTVQERGWLALLRFRMDFLLLLPHGVRVVIEADGKHHYSGSDGVADGARYSAMAAADRELKLAGYQVFRFGAEELRGDAARGMVKTFFDRPFKRYGVEVPGKWQKSAARNR